MKKSDAQLNREIAKSLGPALQPIYGVRLVPSERAGYKPGKYVVQYKDGNGMWFDIGDPKSKPAADAVARVEALRIVRKR